MRKASALLFMVLSLGLLTMCGGSGGDSAGVQSVTGSSDSGTGGSSSEGSSGGSGLLRVQLTDKPAEEYQAVYVTISAVRVHQSSSAGEQDGEWVELPVTAAMPVDLLTLRNGVLMELCQTQLAAGSYQQVRLVLTANSGSTEPYNQYLVTADGEKHPLEVPSGTIKIVHGFSTAASQTTDLTLDFDASKSVVARGNGSYGLKPVIKATSSTSTTTS